MVVIVSARLATVAETDRKFEPVLAGKGSPGPDRLNVLCDQVLHFHLCCFVMDPQKVPADFEGFREVYLVLVFCPAPTDVHSGYDGRAEVVQDGTRPYFLNDVLVFFGMECFEAQWIFKVPE